MDKRWIIGTGLAVVLLLGAAWALGFFNGLDPEVAELQTLRDEGFSRMEQMSDEERRAHFAGFRERVGQLSPDQRNQFFDSSRDQFQQMAMQRMNEFFAKPPAEQRKELDDMIDRMEQRQGDNPGGRGGNRPEMSPQQMDQRMKQGLDRTSPDMRARMNQFREMLNNRREERGLQPMQGPPRVMFGGGGGGGAGVRL